NSARESEPIADCRFNRPPIRNPQSAIRGVIFPMMNWIVAASLRLRVVVTALAVVLMVAGIQVVRTTPIDVFPEFAPPLVEIQTEAPGLATTEVESLVTVPIENALNGTVSLKTLRSKSVLGLSSVVLIFQQGTHLMTARQMVQERLATVAGHLPSVA